MSICQVRRAVVIIGAHRSESLETAQLRHHLIGRAINVLRNDTADGVSVLALRLIGCADVDLQHRTRRDDRGQARNCR